MIFAPFSRYSTSSIPSLSQKTCHHPGGWILCSKHFWMRWTTVSPLLRMLFCLWIIQMYQCFIQCHKVSQETCCVLSKMLKNCLWSHNTLTLLICIQTFWHPLGRELSHDQHIMDDESYTFLIYLQSLLSFCWKFSTCQDHAVNCTHIFMQSDYKWPSWMVFIFNAEISCLKLSNPVFNCWVGRTFFA